MATTFLVLFQGNKLGSSVPVVHLAAEHHRSARRVGLSTSMAALLLLQRTTAIRCEERLALNVDRPTESQFITLKEYWLHHTSGQKICNPWPWCPYRALIPSNEKICIKRYYVLV